MTRFGDFTLLEDLGRSAVSDRYRAMHATQGGPFFLKVYTRLDSALHPELLARCDALIGQEHTRLARHLGHGVVDNLPFVVSPFIDGVDLGEMCSSLKDRRVVLGMDAAVLLLADLAEAVGGLHAVGGGRPMTHGDVSLHHVRIGPDGQVFLTGLTTPRGDTPGRPLDARWDLAGVGALIYDLVPFLRGSQTREPLPVSLDRVVRRALGIGPREDHFAPIELSERLHEVAHSLDLKLDRGAFAELVRRTVRAIERRHAEHGKHMGEPAPDPDAGRRLPSDHIPSLEPVDLLPVLEPLPVAAPARPAPPRAPTSPTPPRPAPPRVEALEPPSNAAPPVAPPWAAPIPMAELIPIPTVERPAVLAREAEAHTRLVERERTPTPPRTPPPAAAVVRPLEPAPSAARASSPPPAAAGSPPARVRPPDAGPAPSMRSETTPTPVAARRPTPESTPAARLPAASGARSLVAELPRDIDDPTGPAEIARPATPHTASSPTPPPRPPTQAPPPAPPPLGRRAAGPARKPLLADPDEPATQRAAPAAPVHENTRDATDPEQRSARGEQMRRDPAVVALLARGTIVEAGLDSAVQEHLQRGGRVLEILVAQGATTDAAIADALSAAAGCARLTDQALTARRPSPLLARRMPQTYLLARRVLPLSLDHGKLSLAVADPFDHTTVEELRSLLQANDVELCVAARAAVTAATVEVYRALSGASAAHDTATVLICTADEAAATRIGGRLVQEGMRVEHVVDGRAAEEILRARPPVAVLCAHQLPNRSAQELLLLAREDPRTADLPFFVLGPRDEAITTRMLDLGADDYFGEPLRLEVVLAKVRRAVGKGSSRSSADGSPITDRSGIFSTVPTTLPQDGSGQTTLPPAPALAASGSASGPTAAPLFATPIATPIATTAPPPSGGFLDTFDVGGLDDLPELPPDFVTDDVLQPAGPSMPTGVMGTLRQMPVPEIVQSLEMGRKTARVDLVPADGEKGVIAFEGGALRYAECGALMGAEAFYRLVRHKEGFFRIHYGDKPPGVNIDAPTTFLLLEAMRLMDEEGQDLSGR